MSDAGFVAPAGTEARPDPAIIGRPPLGAVRAASASHMAELRRWSAHVRRSKHERASVERWGARGNEVVRLLRHVPRRVLGSVRRHGAFVRERYGVGLARQALQAWWLCARYALLPESYHRYALYRPERWARRAEYTDYSTWEHILRFLFDRTGQAGRDVLSDKTRFPAWCADAGVPGVPTLRIVDAREAGTDRTAVERAARLASQDGPLPGRDLFTKPSELLNGIGARRWLAAGDGTWRGAEGEPLSADALLLDLAAQSAQLRQPIIVQSLVRNHADLHPITRGGLATLRVVTCCMPDGGGPALVVALLRMPGGDSVVDNFSQGGLIAPVELETGRLRPAIRRDAGRGEVVLDVHPDTGGAITGRVVPFWKATLELALHGHAALGPALPAVGWDIAVTDTGPVFIEGNAVPGCGSVQVATGYPLADTSLVPCLLARLERTFGPLPG